MAATEWLLRDQVELQYRLSLAARVGRIGSTGLVALLVIALSVAALRDGRMGAWVRRAGELFAGSGKLAAGLLVAVFVAGWAMRPTPALAPLEKVPNILLISIDTLRSDHLSSYGYERPTSPRLDELAREGVRFENVVAPTSWTLPSHMSMLTGLDPLLTGVYVDTRSLPPDTDTLALRLSRLGYATGGVVSAGYLNAKWGFARGFDYYDDFSVGKRHFGADKQEITSPHIIQLANRWLDQWQRQESERPFFLFLHFYDVHYDFNPPPPYDTMFDPDYKGSLTGLDFDTNPALKPGLPQEDLNHLLSLYDGEIRHMDDQLGGFFDDLRQRGLFDDTIIAVTSDHGEEFGEHGRFGHRATLYDEVLLVPLIVRFPAKIRAGGVVPDQVRSIDIGPTLLELAGTDAAGFGSDGVDPLYQARTLVPLLDPESARGPERLAFGDLLGGKLRSVRTPAVKYVVDSKGRQELYDLVADPGEERNMSSADAGEQALSGLVESWVQFSESKDSQTQAVRASPQQIETLKSLGYIN
ncbi:MAG: sulfatase-like hydrolase/transferase [Acidobacteria bacterium]|nr:sulfatase-like hydrolase/transferase [Acidobacteriota bacterium]